MSRNLVRIFREEVLFEFVDCPLDGVFSALLDDGGGFITDHDERTLNDNREVRARSFFLS